MLALLVVNAAAQTCHLDLVSGLSIAQEVGADTLLLGVLLVLL